MIGSTKRIVFMITYRKKDVILIPFPFSELTYVKKRPALVLANIQHRDELICMMLTSTKNIDPTVDIPIHNLESAGLPKPTVARTSRLFTLKSTLVVKKLGEVDEIEFGEILAKVITLLK